MEKYYNIEEQRLWNLNSNWETDGHEWSKSFGTTENLWNNEIFDKIKEFRGKKILEIAPGFGRITQFLSILAGDITLGYMVVQMNQHTMLQVGLICHQSNSKLLLKTIIWKSYLKM